MSFLQEWLKRLVGLTVLMGFAELILPEGDLQKFVRMVMGLIVILLLLQPLVQVFGQGFRLEDLVPELAGTVPSQASVPALQADKVTNAGLDALSEATAAELEDSIAKLCADRFGVNSARVVVTMDDEGSPRVTVWLDRQEDETAVRELLSAYYSLPPAAIEVRRNG